MKKIFKNPNNISLKTQLSVSLVAIIFVILFLAMAFIHNDVIGILKERSDQLTISRFRQTEYKLNSLVENVNKISNDLVLYFGTRGFMGYETLSNIETIPQKEKVLNLTAIYGKLGGILANYEYIDSIYILDQKGLMMGVSEDRNDYLRESENDTNFYESILESSILKKLNSLKWVGGYKKYDFISTKYEKKPEVQYITALRNVFSDGKERYTLIINIDESKIYDIYNDWPSENTNSRKYIVNSEGKIISDDNKENISNYSESYSMIDKEYGSYTDESKNPSMQIVYYQIEMTKWYLMQEIPTSAFVYDTLKFRKTIVYVFLISLIIAVLIAWYWMYRITKPLNDLSEKMYKIEQGQIGITLNNIPNNELGVLGNQFNSMSKSIQSLMDRNEKILEEKRNFEINALRSQINPHFIYNTLNTIKWMAINIRANTIVDSINALVNILRPVFKNKNIFSTVKDELKYVEEYIKIVNYRYGEGISLKIQVPEAMKELRLPHFTLQPIVENAVSHGLKDKEYIGEISIYGYLDNNKMDMIITDDGQGMKDEIFNNLLNRLNDENDIGANEEGIGCVNIHHRLKLHFGDEYGLTIVSKEGGGTTVNIHMPVLEM